MSYDHRTIEARWSARWAEARLFIADARGSQPTYSIVMPPPSVSSIMHLGHALQATIQDICARYRRMIGYEVLWLPGTDHATIATQDAVERHLAREGLTREALGRASFDQRVARWNDEMISKLMAQFGQLGTSLDLSRLRFTMDPDYQHAVRTAFVRFWEQGRLYRDLKVVNWCARCRSVVSDMEVAWQQRCGTRHIVRYAIEGWPGEELPVATARPELLVVAVTGVAVDDADPRYRHLVGRRAVLPVSGGSVPIVADRSVRRGGGTVAVAVTPAHDAEHWELARRHNLPVRVGLRTDGRVDAPGLPAYDGLSAEAARDLVLQELATTGRIVRSEAHPLQVGHCDRCGAEVEPLASRQWFMAMAPLVQTASEVGEVRWHPDRYERIYLRWLRDMWDWCISRQLWLGHRIPVYTCADGHEFAAMEEPGRCPECGDSALTADPDVLDTWFAQALWSFAALGWPADTDLLRRFYPTNLSVTSGDVLRLGVSRMILVGLQVTGSVPFTDLVVTGVVTAADGRKMITARGNAVRPGDVIHGQGADALRGWAAACATAGQEIRFDKRRVAAFRRLAEKLWHAHRLVMADPTRRGAVPTVADGTEGTTDAGSLADRWITSRLQALIVATTDGISSYQFHRSINTLDVFIRRNFCSWYLEAVKPQLRNGDPATRATAIRSLDTLLRLLHPFMPFITEELWHRLPGARDFLVRATWPEADERLLDPEAEARVASVDRLVHEVRANPPSGVGSSLRGSAPMRTAPGPTECRAGRAAGLGHGVGRPRAGNSAGDRRRLGRLPGCRRAGRRRGDARAVGATAGPMQCTSGRPPVPPWSSPGCRRGRTPATHGAGACVVASQPPVTKVSLGEVYRIDMAIIPEKPSLEGLEAKWDVLWQDQGTYRFDRSKTRDEIYTIDTPPPTISGFLHLGTAFGYIQVDAIARFQRMRGREVFYPMGWDDNGLPTERRVQNHYGVRCDPSVPYEPDLVVTAGTKGQRPISRPNFVELCQRLTAEFEHDFEQQWRTMGLSVDWSLTYATIGARSRRVAQRAFLRNINRGEAYAIEAPTMWDVDFQTAVAQAEFEDRPTQGAFYRLAFARVDGGAPVEIETTRPELLPSCVALVAHPDDDRYRALIGTHVTTPVFEVHVPVVAHQLADPEKGSGIAMICTFGDTTDVVWWRELDLPTRSVIRRDGRFQEETPGWLAGAGAQAWTTLAGKFPNQARRQVVELLTGSGQMIGDPRPITHEVKFYEKGERPLEIVTSRQWYIRNGARDDELRETLIRRGRELLWHPDFMRVRYEHWVEGLNTDWLISRQRYFGVPFPVWYPLDNVGEVLWDTPILPDEAILPIDPQTNVPAGYDEGQRGKPAGFIGDPDVMDTWATSSLTPQIAGGWEDDDDLFSRVFPTDLRPQGPEIIRTWLFSTLLRSELEHGTLPWQHSTINGWILDPDRKKMSKSKDNVLAPMPLVTTYGADGFRYWSCKSAPGTDTAADQAQMKVGRRLAIKILNVGKFVLGLGRQDGTLAHVTEGLDRAMLAQLATLVDDATAAFDGYHYHRALELAESFFWRFCDDYVELVKQRAYDEGPAARSAQAALSIAHSILLRMFAPFLPFVTEEVWSRWQTGSVHRAPWPRSDELREAGNEADPAVLEVARSVLAEIRKAKSEQRRSQRSEVARLVVTDQADQLAVLSVAETDLLRAGSIRELVLREATARTVSVELAPATDEVRGNRVRA